MYPFPYLNHGPLDPDSFDKADGVWVGFHAPVSDEDQRAIMTSCPAPVSGFYRWGDGTLFYSESAGDVYAAMVAVEHGEDDGRFEVTADAACAFSEEVEAWITGIHATNPIAFFIGPSRTLDADAWADWSSAQIMTTIVPWLEAFLDAHPDLPDEVDEIFDEAAEGPTASPMDRYFLSSIVQHLEVCEDDPDRLAALAERIEGSDGPE